MAITDWTRTDLDWPLANGFASRANDGRNRVGLPEPV
jgi:D-mannonate dehydratase